MGRLDEIEVLVQTCRAMARRVSDRLESYHQQLTESASTHLLVGVDVCLCECAASAVGCVSLYESRLKKTFGWAVPFKELQEWLSQNNQSALALEVELLVMAINVLKHGEGRSLSTLQNFAGKLPFDLHLGDGEFDVCFQPELISVGPDFVEYCADLIERTWKEVQQQAS